MIPARSPTRGLRGIFGRAIGARAFALVSAVRSRARELAAFGCLAGCLLVFELTLDAELSRLTLTELCASSAVGILGPGVTEPPQLATTSISVFLF